MNIITFIIIGLIAGWLGSLIMEGHGLGALGDIVVGIIGAFVGGFVFQLMGVSTYGFWGSVGMSVVGAVVFLFLIGLFSGPFGSHRPLGKT